MPEPEPGSAKILTFKLTIFWINTGYRTVLVLEGVKRPLTSSKVPQSRAYAITFYTLLNAGFSCLHVFAASPLQRFDGAQFLSRRNGRPDL